MHMVADWSGYQRTNAGRWQHFSSRLNRKETANSRKFLIRELFEPSATVYLRRGRVLATACFGNVMLWKFKLVNLPNS